MEVILDDKNVPIASATFDTVSNTVTLTPRGKVPAQATQLSIVVSEVLDAPGHALDGNRDGQPGGDFLKILGK